MIRVVCVALVVLAVAQPLVGQGTKLTASPECAGEIRLEFASEDSRRQQDRDGAAEHVVKRDTQDPQSRVVGVAYRPATAADSDGTEYKEFTSTGSDRSGPFRMLIRDLEAGQKYHLKVRFGQRSAEDSTEWDEDSETSVEARSGTINAKAGPAGVGEASRDYCKTRQRSDGTRRPKQSSRTHRSTFTSGSRRRRTYTLYDYSYYDYYNYGCDDYSYLSYYDCGSSFSLGGTIAGVVIGVVFLVAGIITFCRFYYYGCCGRPAYRTNYGVRTTVITTTATRNRNPGLLANAQPIASTVVPASAQVVARPVAAPVRAVRSDNKMMSEQPPAYHPPAQGQPQPPPGKAPAGAAYPPAPYPPTTGYTPYPNQPAQNPQQPAHNPLYPGGAQATAPAWGGVSPAPAQAPAAAAQPGAPPSYTDTTNM